MEAIDEVDLSIFDSIREHRNELAHKPMAFLADIEKNIDTKKFSNLIDLLTKIKKW